MGNKSRCAFVLPCGHQCPCIGNSPHWQHARQRCKKKCMKKVCSRQHTCGKQCWETCGPCKFPVSADLPCGHEAELPCYLVDSYNCQELCEKVVCSEGHICGKECWEDCGPCMVPIPRKLPCSHHVIIPCYLNNDSYKCTEKCGKIVCCEFEHECEKECWESCIPCASRVRRTLSCGHEVTLPCYISIQTYRCQKPCDKILCSNNHRCHKACWEECGPCRSKMGIELPCSHKVILPCGINIDTYLCKHICSKELCTAGHKCQKKCWEECSSCPCLSKEKKL